MTARGIVPILAAGLLLLAAAPAAGQAPPVEQTVEAGLGLGRYAFDGVDESSWFDSQFVRYSRSRAWVDAWRVEVGRQHRFGASSLDGGLSYTRFFGRTGVTAGISSGTDHDLAPAYRWDLGVSRPVAGFLVTAGFSRIVSRAENRSSGWSLGATRWFGHLILAASHRIDLGQPGDTESHTTALGATYYVWRRTYLGAAVDFGQVTYFLVPEGTPLADLDPVDYDAWNWNLTLSQYLDERSGINLRYDHGQALGYWDIDGITVSYFREW